MGYTHYWKNKGFSDEQWNQIGSAALRIFTEAKAQGIDIARESDRPSDSPEITTEEIIFNGIGDDGHETFYLSKFASDFEFCKTAYKHYDAVVVAILIYAANCSEGFSWSSDGIPEEHNTGLALVNKATSLDIQASNAG